MKNLKEGWLHAEIENIKGEIKNHIYEIKLKICLILKNKYIFEKGYFLNNFNEDFLNNVLI